MNIREIRMDKFKLFLLVTIFVFGLTHISTSSAQTLEPRGRYIYTHNPVSKALHNEPIEISVPVEEFLPGDVLKIHFKEKWEVDYRSFPMGYNPSTKHFEFIIDERFHTDENLEYYIDMFPLNGQRIRLPAGNTETYTIQSYSKPTEFLEPVFYAILILSPVIALFIARRFYRVHVQRTTKYEHKLRIRKRKLKREREKHYKDYMVKMSGSRKPVGTAGPVASPGPRVPEKQERKQLDMKAIPSYDADPNSSTGELKRELDSILQPRSDEPELKPKTGPKRKPVKKPPSSKQPQPPTRRPLNSAAKPAPPTKSPQRKKTPPVKRPVSSETEQLPKKKPAKPPSKISDETESLGKDDRDKLLDILGLDI